MPVGSYQDLAKNYSAPHLAGLLNGTCKLTSQTIAVDTINGDLILIFRYGIMGNALVNFWATDIKCMLWIINW